MPLALEEAHELALEEAHELVYFLVVIIIGEKYYVFGYAGSMSFTDLAYLIMCASGSHIVALPGASENCLFIGTTAAWIGL